jgi:hypothetical protein
MKLKLTVLLIFQFLFLFSQKIDLNKSILVIPDSLTKNANVVVRHAYTSVEVHSEKSMTITYNKLITVLNKRGDRAYFVESYDKHSKINDIKITIYNSLGKLIKKVKKKEINDVASASDNYYLFSDDRYKYYEHIPLEYPYTIEISYTVQTSNTAFIPTWYVCDSYYESTQKASYTISYSNNLKLSNKEYNFNNTAIIKKQQGNTLNYHVDNFKALKQEPYSPSFSDIIPNVRFALNKFSLAGEIGDASSWESFGKWMNEKLLNGRNEIPDTTKKDIKKLIQGIENPIERAKLVYEYMQNRTRYISIQIGIGGWKPMLAKDVDRLRYGDCKALSYYTKSLLEEANVKSEYSIVFSDSDYKKNIDKDLVSVQGNHAILMVPNVKDTIWLECTSQKLPFGQTGSTDDRDVMIISDNVGKIVHTNKYKPTHNLQKTTGEIIIEGNNSIKAKINISSFGKQYNNHFRILYKDKEDQIKYYKNKFSNLVDAAIDSINLKNDKEKIVFTEQLQLTVPNYTEKIGNDMIVRLNAFNIYSKLPKRIKDRKHPLFIMNAYLDEDKINIVIPENYKIDKLPKDVFISNKFGTYKVSIVKSTNNKLLYKRYLLMNASTFPKSDYTAYRNFRKSIIKYDKQKIIIIKK